MRLAKPTANEKAVARRRVWLKLHLWLGLPLGAVWVLLGLTGSLNVFRWDIDEWLNPELVISAPGDAPLALERIYQRLHAAFPEREGSWSLETPRHPAGMLTARHASKLPNGEPSLLFVSINPYTAEIAARRFYADFGFWVTWIYQLHSSLFLGEMGPKIVGAFGLLLAVSLASGLYLWWPRTGKLRQALSFKPKAGRVRRNYDLHKLSGIYGGLLLLAVALSGAGLVFKAYIKPVVTCFSPVYGGFNPQPPAPEDTRSTPAPGSERISLDLAAAIAKRVFPAAELRFVKTPAGGDGFYAVQLRQPQEASQFFTTTSVWIDQYGGQVLAVRDPRAFSAGETFLNLFWPVHNGEVLGLAGRILVCIAGLLPLALYTTGLIRWRQKRQVERRLRQGV